jgi:hypothetical protein
MSTVGPGGLDDLLVTDFFGLAPIPQASAGQGIYQADVVAYTSGCPGVASSVVYLHTGNIFDNGTLDTSKPTTILSQVPSISTIPYFAMSSSPHPYRSPFGVLTPRGKSSPTKPGSLNLPLGSRSRLA